MEDLKKEQIGKVVYKFAELSKIDDKDMCESLINKLCSLSLDDSIDTILVSLNSLLNRKVLTTEDIFSNANLLLALNPEKYHSTDDLIGRLQNIRSRNMEHPQMSLEENHKLVLEAFDNFNELIKTDFDCFYTGGLMGYLVTNHPLERYHGDLDLFINEEQLIKLYDVVKQNEDFEFVSNMDHKETNGHEYKITYKGTPMSIGLFLFSRLPNQEIVIKEYYYEDQDKNKGLFVNERHLSPEYASMIFVDEIKEHNNTFYRMQSLESIYNSKKNSRPKDRYDANIIKDSVDLSIDYKLDTQKQDNYDINHKPASGSIIEVIEGKINQTRTSDETVR